MSSSARVVAIALVAVALASGCKKKKEGGDTVPAPPPEGASNTDELSLPIGTARAIEDAIAPSSTKWKRVIVLDDKRAILIGQLTTEAVAIITSDAGATWKPLRMPNEGWSTWSAASDGTVVLAVGTRGGAKTLTGGTLEATKLSFASFDTPALTAPIPLFPIGNGPLKGTLESATAIPFIVTKDFAAVEGEDGRAASLYFGGRPGSVAQPATKLPPGEKMVPSPYGRPPLVVTMRGRDLVVRPAPAPATPLDKPEKVTSPPLPASAFADLSQPPACEWGDTSFQRLKGPPKSMLVALSTKRKLVLPLPDSIAATAKIGCSSSRVAFDAIDPATKALRIGECTLDGGACTVAANNPFRVWPEAHENEVAIAPTDKGVVAILQQRAGARWGLYLAQSRDGTMYEVPRIIGEGKDRGQLELGALLVFGERAVLILGAEVTGTTRRSWYAIATDDGGLNWSAP